MLLPTLRKWDAGTQPDETTFNEVSYAIGFLNDPPDCRLNQTTTQSIPNGITSATAVTFQSASWDNDSMWNAVDPTDIHINTSGWYEIEYAVAWATKAADTTIRIQGLYLNGIFSASSTLGYSDWVNDASTTPQISQSYDLFLSEGDQLSLGLMQLTGAALSTASHATTKDLQTFLRVRWASL